MRKFQQLLAALALALSLGEPAISETSKYNQLKGKQLQADTKCRFTEGFSLQGPALLHRARTSPVAIPRREVIGDSADGNADHADVDGTSVNGDA